MRGRDCCVFDGRTQCVGLECSLKCKREALEASCRPSRGQQVADRKPLQIKIMLISDLDSIFYRQNLSNLMILNNRGEGGGSIPIRNVAPEGNLDITQDVLLSPCASIICQ
jgi:hypothetical protein